MLFCSLLSDSIKEKNRNTDAFRAIDKLSMKMRPSEVGRYNPDANAIQELRERVAEKEGKRQIEHSLSIACSHVQS